MIRSLGYLNPFIAVTFSSAQVDLMIAFAFTNIVYYYMRVEDTLLETNGLHLKIDGWKLKFLLKWPIFRRELLGLGSVYNRVSSPPIFVVPLNDEKIYWAAP